MWKKLAGTAIGLLGWAAVASAQFGGYGMGYGGYGGYGGGGYGGYGGGGYGGYGGGGFGGGGGMFMPNIYNQQTQPLSPYLNMFRGAGNPAAGYYFGTRPGTVGRGGYGYGMAPNMAFGGNLAPFPFTITEEEALPIGEKPEHNVLPPAGHRVMFNNTMGFYPYPFINRYGGRGMGGYGMGGGYGRGGYGMGGQGTGSSGSGQGSTSRQR